MPEAPFSGLSFASDYGLETGAVTRNYVNVRCPWCNGSETSPTPLGLHLQEGRASCWRCGSHDLIRTIAKILGIPRPEAHAIRDAYSFSSGVRNIRYSGSVSSCPLSGGPLTKPYRDYLEGRGFDPDWHVLEHGILAAGPSCTWYGESQPSDEWKGLRLDNRLVIPLHDAGGRVVNFQARSIVPNRIRYMGPPVDRVPVHQKHVLYGANKAGGTVAVVEGIFDQWRLGRGSVATLGTSLTRVQVKLLAGFRRVLFLFDSEPEAQARAMRYAKEVGALGGREVEVVDLELGDRDLGDLSEEDARAVRREIGLE